MIRFSPPDMLACNCTPVCLILLVSPGVQICVFVDPSIDCRVSGDGDRLRQILLNLLSNAVKFSHTGAVLLEVSVDQKNANGTPSTARTFRFSCRDEGIGISAVGIRKLFKRFSQVVEMSACLCTMWHILNQGWKLGCICAPTHIPMRKFFLLCDFSPWLIRQFRGAHPPIERRVCLH